MRNVTSLLATIAVFSAPAGWAVTECTQGSLTRSVSVVYADPGQPVPCEVLYEKPSEQQTMTLWRAENEAGYCEDRAREFVEKLNSLGWDCTESAAVAEPELVEEPEPATDVSADS